MAFSPDPSINHNIASEAHHNGTSNGSFKGVFIGNGSPLVHSCGYMENVRSSSTLPHHNSSLISHFRSWLREKCSLVCLSSPDSDFSNSHRIFSSSIIQDIMTLSGCWKCLHGLLYFDFRDIDKQKLARLVTLPPHPASAQSDPCCDISLNSIPHTIVERGSLIIEP